MSWRRAVAAVCAVGLLACHERIPSVPVRADVAAEQVVAPNQQALRVGQLTAQHALTVFVFFSATCPTVAAHDERLKALSLAYERRDVGFYAIASEADVTPAMLRDETARRGYSFPLLADPGGKLARDLNVRYASQAFVLRPDASVAYEGGIDSDRRFLHADAQPFLRDALNELLDGRAPTSVGAAVYGCALAF